MISNPISICFLGCLKSLEEIYCRKNALQNTFSGRVYEGRSFIKFIDDSLREFATLSTFAANTQFAANISHTTGSSATQIAYLVISNLTANTYVHGTSSIKSVI